LKAEVHEQLKIKGRQPRRFLNILLGTMIAFICSAATSTTVKVIPGEKASLSDFWRKWVPIDTFSTSETLAAFKRGVDSFNDERYTSALDALPEDSEARKTAIADYILFYRAKSRLSTKPFKIFVFCKRGIPIHPCLTTPLWGSARRCWH
jgi:hypothetical protein